MKFLCPNCDRLSSFDGCQLDNGAAVVTCAGCGASHRIPVLASPQPTVAVAPPNRGTPSPVAPIALTQAVAPSAFAPSSSGSLQVPAVRAVEAAKSALANPFLVPEHCCPKCIAARNHAAVACAQCGLLFAQYNPIDNALSTWLSATWRSLLENWGQEARHESAVAQAAELGELAGLGRLYRLRLAYVSDDPWAIRGRDAVLRRAALPTSATLVEDSNPRRELPRWAYVAMFLVFISMLGGVFFMARGMLGSKLE